MASGHAAPQRANYPYLDDNQWAILEKMDAVVGAGTVGELLTKSPDEIVARLARFREYEIALHDHVMATVKAEIAAAVKIASPPPPSTPTITYVQSPAAPAPPYGPKPLRLSVTPYGGEETENLVFRFRENEIAMTAADVVDERQRVAYAISIMNGRAKTWALTLETTHPGFFTNWTTMVSAMKNVLLPPNVAHRQRAAFLTCAQGDRELYVYVQELRQLIASMTANSIPEDVKLTTFIENMKGGPVKAAVFRGGCTTLEEAFTIALVEDYVQRTTRNLPVNPAAMTTVVPSPSAGAEPMDLSSIDLSVLAGVDLSTFDLSVIDVKALHIDCFTCGKRGHFQRNCPRNRSSRPDFRLRRGNGRGRRAGTRNFPANASQGNVSSQ